MVATTITLHSSDQALLPIDVHLHFQKGRNPIPKLTRKITFKKQMVASFFVL